MCIKKINDLSRHENVGGFIYQTAKYQAANHLRKSKTKRAKEVHDTIDQMSESKDAHDLLLKEHDDNIDIEPIVDEVINMLSDKNKELYKLYYIEKLGYKEIGILLDMKEPAVRMKYVRLRREIQTLANEYAKNYFELPLEKNAVI